MKWYVCLNLGFDFVIGSSIQFLTFQGLFKSSNQIPVPSFKFSEILRATKEDAPSVLSPRGDNRRAHYMRLKALLFHLRDDTHEINPDMCEVFSDLLTRENWELISAYELYLLNDDKEDLVDTLFVIYKMYSGSAAIVSYVDSRTTMTLLLTRNYSKIT